MDIPRSPLVRDGPEYSRLSDSVKNHWYAEGHTDSMEEEDDDERLGIRRRSDDRAGHSSRRSDTETEERGERIPSPTGNDLGGASAAAGAVVDVNTHEPTNGSEADDETSPVLSQERTHLIPATSVQETGPQVLAPSSSLREDWSQPTQRSRCKTVCSYLGRPSVLVGIICLLSFSMGMYLVFSIWLVPRLKSLITQPAILRPTLSSFTHPRGHTTMDVYFYNVTPVFDPLTENTEFRTEELGPYRYVVKSTKTDVVWNSNFTVSYRLKQSFHFKPNHSRGVEESDTINTVSADAIAKQLSDRKANKSDQSESRAIPYLVPDTDLFQSQSVGRFLWGEGNDKIRGGKTGMLKLFKKSQKKSGTRCNFMKKNESLSPVYNVFTGYKQMYRLNRVYSYNYSRTQNRWNGTPPQSLPGTADGDFFSPLLNTDDQAMFYSQIGRNTLLRFERMLKFRGFDCSRFVLAGDHHPARTSATPSNNTVEGASLAESGGLNASFGLPNAEEFVWQAEEGSPFVLSMPNPKKRNGSLCQQYLDVNLVSGITLRKRLCHTVSLPVKYPHQGRELQFFLPVMRMDLFSEFIPDDLNQITQTYEIMEHSGHGQTVALICMIIFAICFTIQIVLVVFRCYWRQK